jgi:hypothetical protein
MFSSPYNYITIYKPNTNHRIYQVMLLSIIYQPVAPLRVHPPSAERGSRCWSLKQLPGLTPQCQDALTLKIHGESWKTNGKSMENPWKVAEHYRNKLLKIIWIQWDIMEENVKLSPISSSQKMRNTSTWQCCLGKPCVYDSPMAYDLRIMGLRIGWLFRADRLLRNSQLFIYIYIHMHVSVCVYIYNIIYLYLHLYNIYI